MPAECEIDRCGVLAIGRCGNCSQAFCRSHGGVIRNDLGREWACTDWCKQCQTRGEERDAQRRRDGIAGEVSRLKAITDPTERLLCALQALEAKGTPLGMLSSDHRAKIRLELCGRDPSGNNSPEIAKWFARRAAAARLPVENITLRMEHEEMVGRFRPRMVPQTSLREVERWRIAGLRIRDTSDMTPSQRAATGGATILVDGDLIAHNQYLAIHHLVEMARMLKLA